MAHQNEEFAVDRGPSKYDLMLSLFDTEMGVRTVRFRLVREIGGDEQPGFWYDIKIISARRRQPSAKIWDIEGITETQDGKKRVSIYYLSDTREGRMRIEKELRTHGVMEALSDSRKREALMIVIQKMIARYQNSHSGNLDEEIFVLFEKAKTVSFAEDHESLAEAIKDI